MNLRTLKNSLMRLDEERSNIMKVKIIFLIITTATIITMFFCYDILNSNQEIHINLEYIKETDADFSEIYEGYGSKLKDDFTWWYQARDWQGYEGLESIAKRFKINCCTDFNFSDNYMIISLGRELEDLVYTKGNMRSEDNSYVAYPRFNLHEYNKNKAYIYAMKKIPLVNTEFYGSSFMEQNYKDFENH